MSYSLEPVPTYFVHVPKTGGVTLGSWLEMCFKRGERVRLDPPRMARLTLDQLKRFRLYHSMHQGRTLLELTGRTDLTCITMVRDPIERSVSQIQYLKRMIKEIPHTFTPEYLDEVRPIVEAKLGECLDHQVFSSACDSQLRTLGIREDYRPLFKGSSDANSGRSIVRPYPLPPLMEVSDHAALLTNAQRWLGEMAVVGLTEKYHESVLLVSDVLGIPAPARIPLKNADPGRKDGRSNYRKTLTPQVIGRLQELTQLDQVMYDHACELFQEQWKRFQTRPKGRTYSLGAHVRYAINSPVGRLIEFVRPGRYS